VTPILLLFINERWQRNIIFSSIKGGTDLYMKKHKIHPVFWLVAVGGLLFMVFGVWREEIVILYQKAVYICMECIGIG